jgi:hypothetical protein
VDDAAYLGEEYYRARNSSVVFDAKAPNQRKAVSCVRTCIKLGGKTALGRNEPMTTVDNFVALRKKLRQNPANANKLDDASNSFLRMARAQLKSEQPLSHAELEAVCFKREAKDRTLEDVIGAIRKNAQNLLKGKNGLLDDSEQMQSVVKNCTDRLKDLVAARTGPVTIENGNGVDVDAGAEAMKQKFAAMEAEQAEEDNAEVKEATA